MNVGRRRFATSMGAAGAALALERWLGAQAAGASDPGRLVRTMPLGRFDGRPEPPLHTLLGSGLDARQFTDLSALDAAHLAVPTDRFYIRTAHPQSLPPQDTWQIMLGGLVQEERTIAVSALRADVHDTGMHVLECAGNVDPANFGLLSAASWQGVPIVDVLARVRPVPAARRIRITGVDDHDVRSMTSTPGASWIFTPEELERAGAFLAVGMNGAPLTADHGAPVRLVVPNYFGCSCIKWLSRIDWVADDEAATSQMREFSARTHQSGVPQLARDYTPPAIELAAMPIRVEQWRDSANRISYRIVGIRWGGTSTRPPLTIRFRHTERFVPVEDVATASAPTSWSLWTHVWRPSAAGRYQIALGVSDRSIPARRLDLFFYTREVEIDET
jgi:DMSO/TMAO reductase YedYZ molybdopterin-dependent catalytic subunit